MRRIIATSIIAIGMFAMTGYAAADGINAKCTYSKDGSKPISIGCRWEAEGAGGFVDNWENGDRYYMEMRPADRSLPRMHNTDSDSNPEFHATGKKCIENGKIKVCLIKFINNR